MMPADDNFMSRGVDHDLSGREGTLDYRLQWNLNTAFI